MAKMFPWICKYFYKHVLDFALLWENNAAHSKIGDWDSRNVYYNFKNMVLEGSTAIRGVVELSNTIATHHKINIPKSLYLSTDGSGDCKVINLSVQAALTALFLKHDMDEIITCCTTAGLPYGNPVERIHSIVNIGLQSFGLMRQVLDPDKERLIKNLNLNKEIYKACKGNEELKKALAEIIKVPTQLLANIFFIIIFKR